MYKLAFSFHVSQVLFDLVWELHKSVTRLSIAFYRPKWAWLFCAVLGSVPALFGAYWLRNFQEIPRHFRVLVVR